MSGDSLTYAWDFGDVKWAEACEEDLRKRDVVESIPDPVREQVEKIRGVAKLLMKATDVCCAFDEERKSIEPLGRLNGGIAILVYEIKEREEKLPADSSA